MITTLLSIALYLIGYWFAFTMLRIEHAAEKQPYTKGARVLAYVIATLSWIVVFKSLIEAWWNMIAATGYWNTPVEETEVIETKKKTAE